MFKKIILISILISLGFSIPNTMSYQGKLTDLGGAGLNGAYNMTFKLFDAETDGTELWAEAHTGVIIDRGLFSVELGGLGDMAFDADYWLQIIVDGDIMAPRQKLNTEAYAFRAKYADNVSSVIESRDTMIAHWDSLRNIPPELADGDDVLDTDWQIDGDDMYSLPTGNIGIGTSLPDAELHVNGDVHIEGNLIVDGTYSNESICTYWPNYPNAVFWSGAGTEKAISAFTDFEEATGRNFYQITKADGSGVQDYHMSVIWTPPLDYDYANNAASEFLVNFDLTGTGSLSVTLSTSNGSTTTSIGSATVGASSATLTDFGTLAEGEWLCIDIAMDVDDDDIIKLYQIEITYEQE